MSEPTDPRPGGASTEPRPRVKICGHTSRADLDASVAAGADAVGVITAVDVQTPREVTARQAADLLAAVPPLATGVLVTMPETVSEAVRLIGRTTPDAIQVHGTLSPAEVADLRERVDVGVIAAVEAAADGLAEYAATANVLLVDTPAEDGGGGTGRAHDWAATREATADLDVPVILAGGLDPDNVAEAIETVQPFGVDVASGVESEGGRKDHDAVRAFVVAARDKSSVDGAATGGDETAADGDAAGGDAPDDPEPASTEGSR